MVLLAYLRFWLTGRRNNARFKHDAVLDTVAARQIVVEFLEGLTRLDVDSESRAGQS